MDRQIKTPESHPDHPVVGRTFKCPFYGKTYFCDSWDSGCGFWMTNVDDPVDRTCVSERAIGRTFHEVTKRA